MATKDKFHNAVKQALEKEKWIVTDPLRLEYGKEPPINGEIEVEVVFDKERDRYLVIDLGWDRDCRVYNCFMHLDIKEGKIWIQHNQTDKSIAEELVQMGIPKEDIVFGLQPPYMREQSAKTPMEEIIQWKP